MMHTRSRSRKSSRCPSFSYINKQLTSENVYNIVNNHIYLWNPATRFCTKVLELYHSVWADYVTRGGLCFDSSKNDYKAVMFTYDGEYPDWTNFVAVASLKGKKWRRLEFAYDIISVRDGITLHGRLHYRVRVKNTSPRNESVWDRFGQRNKVIYFDAISETFHMLPIPEPDQEENNIVGLGVLNECLCMTRLEHDMGVEILVMKKYGIKESWTSLFLIKNLEIYPYGFVAPFSMTENGELALIIEQINCKVVLYDPKNDNMQDIVVPDMDRSAITYVESLISPKGYYWYEKRHKKYFGGRKQHHLRQVNRF